MVDAKTVNELFAARAKASSLAERAKYDAAINAAARDKTYVDPRPKATTSTTSASKPAPESPPIATMPSGGGAKVERLISPFRSSPRPGVSVIPDKPPAVITRAMPVRSKVPDEAFIGRTTTSDLTTGQYIQIQKKQLSDLKTIVPSLEQQQRDISATLGSKPRGTLLDWAFQQEIGSNVNLAKTAIVSTEKHIESLKSTDFVPLTKVVKTETIVAPSKSLLTNPFVQRTYRLVESDVKPITKTSYEVKLPTAKELHEYYYPGISGNARLVAVHAMELGIPAMVAGGASLFTGDSKFAKAELQRQYEKSINLSLKPGESQLDFTKRFWTSPEAIESVYLPLATMGIGSAYTAIKGGATGAMTVGRLAAFGAKHGTKATKTFEYALLGAGAIGATTSGVEIGMVAATRPELLPSTIGRTAFQWTMAGAGFKTGEYVALNKYGSVVPKSVGKIKTGKDARLKTISNKDMIVQPVKDMPGRYTFETGKGKFGFTDPKTGKLYIGKTRVSGVSQTAKDITFNRAVASSEISLKGGGTRTKFWDVYGFSKTGKTGGKMTSSSEYLYFVDRATGKVTPVLAKTVTRSLGQTVELGIGKPIKLEVKVGMDVNLLGKVKTSYVGELSAGKKAFFDVSESMSWSRFSGEKSVVGKGFDFTKTYIRSGTSGELGSVSGDVKGLSSKVFLQSTFPSASFTSPVIKGVITVKPTSKISTSFFDTTVGGAKTGTMHGLSIPKTVSKTGYSPIVSIGKTLFGNTITTSVSIVGVYPSLKSISDTISRTMPLHMSNFLSQQETSTGRVQQPDYMRVQIPDYIKIQVPSNIQTQQPDQIKVQVPEFIKVQQLDLIRLQKSDYIRVQKVVSSSKFITPIVPIVIPPKVPIAIPFLSLDGGGGRKYSWGVSRGKGYRYREWKVPTMEQFLKGLVR